MNAINPTNVFDLNWLPLYGENSVTCISKNSELIVEILFDDENSDNEQMKTIKFVDVCFYMFASAPGVDLLNIKYATVSDIGALNEFTKSEPADKWTAHFNQTEKKIRHFQIYFLAQNQRLEVFASNFIVT